MNIKPCPFCGTPAEEDENAPGDIYCPIGLSSAEERAESGIDCFNDAILNIEQWNTRPREAELEARVAELETVLKMVEYHDYTCPWCGAWYNQIHAYDCLRQKALVKV